MRPQLTAAQADYFRPEEVLRYTGTAGADRVDPWTPEVLHADDITPDYTVGPGQAYTTVQSAINAALRENWTRRVMIGVLPGAYSGLIYVPPTSFAFTLAGLGGHPSQTVLTDNIDAEMPGAEYAGRFRFADAPASVTAIYQRIAALDKITTANASVVRIESDDFQLLNLTVRNTYNADRQGAEKNDAGQFSTGQHQAVAVLVAGADRVQMQDLILRSFQDTLYLQSPAKGETVRSYLSQCDIEGDVDFIFGQSSAWFERCTIRSLGARAAQSWATAPSTDIRTRYGFVFNECFFTHDQSQVALAGNMRLGRQWFEGVRATPYGQSPLAGYRCDLGAASSYDPPAGKISQTTLDSVGKCVILNARIDGHINKVTPWDDWSGNTWNPRHRPALFTASDMFTHLGKWLASQDMRYDDIDPAMVFLGEFNS